LAGSVFRPQIAVKLFSNGLLQSWKHFPAVIACRLELARGNSAGIELFHEDFVAELFHKPAVDKLADKRLGRPTRRYLP
jgi:hypothetical protein